MARYAVSDLHGRKDIFDKIMSELIGPNDTLYILGDVVDRGPEPFELLRAAISDPRVKLLKGNHEDMFKNAIYEYTDEWYNDAIQLHAYNGGSKTFDDWLNAGAHPSWSRQLAQLPLKMEFENKDGYNLILCHAGFTPGYLDRQPNEKELLWDRHHFHHIWPEGPEFAKTIVIHGHTPILYMPEHLIGDWQCDGALWYCGNHKVNLDTGASYTNVAVVLDLDTFDEHIFEIVKS